MFLIIDGQNYEKFFNAARLSSIIFTQLSLGGYVFSIQRFTIYFLFK